MPVQIKGVGSISGLDQGIVVGIVTSSTQINVGSNIKFGSAGIATASNFKTGSSNLHSTGLTVGNNFLHTTGINVGTGATIHVPASNTLTFGTNSNERLRITSDGKVVAGGSGNGYPCKLQSHGAGDLLDLNSTSGAGKIRFYESGTGRFNIETLNGSSGLRFYDSLNSAERLRITSTGNVNIGTSELDQTVSGRLLNVYGGQIRARQTTSGNTLEAFGHTTSGQSYGLLVNAGTTANDYCAHFRSSGGTALFRIRGDGKVGI